MWACAAQAVLAVHAGWVAAVLFLPLWAWRRPRLRALHLSMMAGTSAFMALGRACPLTLLENALLAKAGPGSAYSGTFLGRYLVRLVYVDLSPRLVTGASFAWLVIWSAAYLGLARRRRSEC